MSTSAARDKAAEMVELPLNEHQLSKLRTWVESNSVISDSYDSYIEHFLIGKDDSETANGEKLQKDNKLKLKYILEKTRPAENNFVPLPYGSMVKAFTFASEPGAKPKQATEIEHNSTKRRKSTHDLDSIASELSDEDETGEKTAQDNVKLVKLQKELLKTIDAMIKCKFPRALKPHVDGFKLMGFPNGNPFAVPLERNGWIPDDYFEIIKQPIDLATIKNRVQDLYYDDYETFAAQARLVISNAFEYNVDERSAIHKMAKVQRKRIEDELNKLQKRLSKEL